MQTGNVTPSAKTIQAGQGTYSEATQPGKTLKL